MAEFINPRVDWAFKRIFGSEDTKECLITFLNGLFAGEFEIKDVKFVPVEQTKTNEDERGVVFDVKCITSDGRHVIVEMQKKSQEYFVDRALFYTCKAIVEQGKKGKWNFHLAPVYTVCFMDFRAKNSIPRQFRTDVGLGMLKAVDVQMPAQKQDVKANSSPGENVELKPKAQNEYQTASSKYFELSGVKYGFEKMRMVFLQLPLFKKKKPVECMDIFDCWIYIIKNMEKLKEMPFIDKYPVFRKLAEIGDLRKLTPEEREYYDEDTKAMRDLYASRLLSSGMSDAQILQYTGLTQGQLDGIKS